MAEDQAKSVAAAAAAATIVEDEEFRPAAEVFHDPSELDFLMQHGGASTDIALARQSLFVKFDPLVSGRPSMFPSPRPSDTGNVPLSLSLSFSPYFLFNVLVDSFHLQKA